MADTAVEDGVNSVAQETAETGSPVTGATASAWSPLRQPLFRALWLASLVSNVGTWMHDVGASWLMTSLAPRADMVALVQAAGSLPIFLLALPSGALADVVDRRRLLLFTQGWMLLCAAILGVLTLAGATQPWTLLLFTSLMSIGGALMGPAWQSIIPEVVGREELPAAISLGGVSINLSRVVGPALGGLVVAAAGPGGVFLLNAASFLAVVAVLHSWHGESLESDLPPEHILSAMRTGMRYVRHAPELRTILIRAAGYIVCASALWAVLPLLARQELKLEAAGYGILMGCLGAGAVAGAALLPRLRARIGINAVISLSISAMAAVLLIMAHVRVLGLLYVAMAVGGLAWSAIMLSFSITVLSNTPAWVRSRAAASFMLVFFGGMAAGSAFWGAVAAHTDIASALTYAALGLVVGLLALSRLRLSSAEGLDLNPSLHYPQPVVAEEADPQHGPVLITVEYRIAPRHSDDFERAMRAVRPIRLRDGAMRWGLFHDLAEPERYLETFLVESWAEHLRQHERMTVADRVIEEQAQAFHSGGASPLVSHMIAAQSYKQQGSAK